MPARGPYSHLSGGSERQRARRSRLLRHGAPALGLALVALAVGLAIGLGAGSDPTGITNGFAAAWQRSDYGAMYGMLTPSARRRVSRAAFAEAYRHASATATTLSLQPARSQAVGSGARVPVTIATRIFGTIRGSVLLPVTGSAVDWTPNLVFPDLPPGAALMRSTRAPRRASILARDGSPIVTGPADARSSPAGNPAAGIAGILAVPTTAAERQALYAEGFPPGTQVGAAGLEHAFNARLIGTPGGTLRTGSRVLATAAPAAAPAVRTTIALAVQAAAEQALGGRNGGIAAVDPRTGEIRALAGIALSPQPPGSTFKIITSTAALEAGLVTPTTSFPVESKTTIEGVSLQNANGESCGGTFANAFAVSCNSVFAPLGVRLGATRLVATAERFGFNQPPTFTGATPSTLPGASRIGSALAVGSTAIGQGRVLATALEMAVVAATIANRGVRLDPSLAAPDGASVHVTSARVAAEVEQLMLGVVDHGTGTAASLAPVRVAGKTGTAELTTTVGGKAPSEQGGGAGQNTDAWFAAYAPVPAPSVAVGVLFVKAGAGGSVAAPAARAVLQAGLSGH